MKLILILYFIYMIIYNNQVLTKPYAMSLSYDCCYNFIFRLPNINKLSGYLKTSTFCRKHNGIIFITTTFKKICSKINKQSKIYVEKLDNSYLYENFEENKVIMCDEKVKT
ncbi:C-C motif chemokine protein [Cotia virus SPAn232]|uniref:C-C motif chemokine protein n=2 Tax=Cotia virus TaxID=39444 RepID=H6TAG3_9POXV|nr:C-C motif chemokine protein [Cotia virus SPAn232]YP_005296364.1 C-C motif chemokine protein [Cotia virus SPAn232]AIT70625.1 C-C motif chemokine protein [Cotia virus]AFB76900.1 C-C motif chemokine protein [Cotia virus SPAn232]AFB76978.1 C-C motif chemokine protein [Cotia virus SPAn232]AIT70791.1 C-C motif chemokine protein [Cotia virus]